MHHPAPRTTLLSALFALGLPAFVQAQAVDPNKEPSTSALSAPISENTHLINLETPVTLGRRKTLYGVEVRPFGSKEASTFVFLEGMYGLTDRLTLLARGGGSMRRYYQNGLLQVPHGGQEVEFGARYRLAAPKEYRLSVEGSVLYENTLLNNKFLFAAQAMASRQFLGDKLTVLLSPRVFLADRSFGTVGLGLTYQIDSDLALVADGQIVVFGENAVRTGDAARIGQEVWGLGLRYSPASVLNGRASLELGVTNGIGRSSGFSATSALSGSASVYIHFGYRL